MKMRKELNLYKLVKLRFIFQFNSNKEVVAHVHVEQNDYYDLFEQSDTFSKVKFARELENQG